MHSKKNLARYDKKTVYGSSCKVAVIFVRFLIKLEFSEHIFEKYANVEFHENPSNGSRVVPCGRTDGHEKNNSPFFFRNSANGLKMSEAVPIHTLKAERVKVQLLGNTWRRQTSLASQSLYPRRKGVLRMGCTGVLRIGYIGVLRVAYKVVLRAEYKGVLRTGRNGVLRMGCNGVLRVAYKVVLRAGCKGVLRIQCTGVLRVGNKCGLSIRCKVGSE